VHACKLRVQLSGDPAFQYTVEDAAAAGQAAQDGSEDSEGAKFVITEVQRLRCIIDGVNREAAVVPKVSSACDQQLFKGLASCIEISAPVASAGWLWLMCMSWAGLIHSSVNNQAPTRFTALQTCLCVCLPAGLFHC